VWMMGFAVMFQRLPRASIIQNPSRQYSHANHAASQTPVSQSNYFVHMDPTLFPEPSKFDPERWVRAAENGEYLSRFIVSFTKGSRQCLGMK
jgi:hypothetical protein